MSKSTQTSSTRPCRLRFVNNCDQAVGILWLTYEGAEQSYASIPANSQHVQETFTTHPWIVTLKDSQQVLGHYIGESAVVEVSPSLSCIIHPGAAKHICPRPIPTPLHWGAYHQRRSVKGIAIMAFDLVPAAAMSAAAEALSYMLADTPFTICKRLAENDADIAIIGRDQVVSDMPPHSHLRGQSCAIGERTFDQGTRGVGGNLGCPTCSVGEENVTMLNDKHYSQESILIHEFAHSVMCIGMDDEQRQSICGAYEEAKQSGLYQKHIYMMANADEYWAEATQSWFDATVRTDVNDGFNTRGKIKAHDPMLATLLMHAYGDGSWRYTHTMPRNWGGRPRSSPVQHPQHQPSLYDQQVHQPVSAPTQTTISFQHHSPQYAQFGGNQVQAQPQRRCRNSSFCCFPFAFLRQASDNKFH